MESTVNPSLQSTSKNTSILWTIVLLICTLGLWGIYLTFRWTKNLNYLEHSEKYNPWIPAIIYAVGFIMDYIAMIISGSWFLDLLSLILCSGVIVFLLVQIESISNQKNSANETRKNVFGWLVTALVFSTIFALITLGHNSECKCFFCTYIVWFDTIASLGSLCFLCWLFNDALNHEKKLTNTAVNENTSNGAWIFGIVSVILAVIVCCMMIPEDEAKPTKREMTVSEFREAAEQEINKSLSTKEHDLRKFVENAHKTVTVHTAYVSDLQITTKDGSNTAGVEGKNIRRIHLEITTRWDGMIHKNGYTVVGIDLENINGEGKVTNAGIIKTDALVNTEDPKFWYEVGAAAALLLL